MKAIVLSGGGAKGAYQIGVWKALKKLNIKYDIITGTSVGALNGALMTQKSYHKAVNVWKNINLKTLFGEKATDSKNNLEIIKMYSDNFIKHGGMEIKPLENLIKEAIDYNSFYNSNINYGLVTFNLSDRLPLQLTKKEIPQNLLVDYLIASSSCYPAFKKKDIKGDKYIDGGIVDNLPINLAIDMGADEIIAIDLESPGIKRTPKKKVPTTIIKPNNKLSNFLNFNEEDTKRNIKLGYNDTLKKLGKLEGKKYTFKKGHINKNKEKYKDDYIFIFNKIISYPKLVNNFKKALKIAKINNDEITNKLLIRIMEDLGKTFNLNETKIYSYKNFNKDLKKQINILLKNKKAKRSQLTILNLYNKIKEKNYKDLKKDALLLPLEFLKALYIYIIYEV